MDDTHTERPDLDAQSTRSMYVGMRFSHLARLCAINNTHTYAIDDIYTHVLET